MTPDFMCLSCSLFELRKSNHRAWPERRGTAQANWIAQIKKLTLRACNSISEVDKPINASGTSSCARAAGMEATETFNRRKTESDFSDRYYPHLIRLF